MVMRTVAIVCIVVGIAMCTMPIAAAQDCQVNTCGRECWAEGGQRRCGMRCRQHCRPAPRYVPPPVPEYRSPHVEFDVHDPPVVARHEPPRIPPEVIGAVFVGVGGIALLLLIIHACNVARMRRDIRIAARRTRTAEELQRRMQALAREADDFITAAAADAYRRGRDA